MVNVFFVLDSNIPMLRCRHVSKFGIVVENRKENIINFAEICKTGMFLYRCALV